MKSMTGFGVARGRLNGREILVEARSVNHRYCEVNLRFPGRFASLEPEVAKLVRGQFDRGKFDLFLREESLHVDEEEIALARHSFRLLKKIKGALALSGPITFSDWIAFRSVQSARAPREDFEKIRGLCRKVVLQALHGLAVMREREGSHLKVWFQGRVKKMRKTLGAVERAVERREKSVTENPLVPDRGDVTEEIVRLKSHLIQFEKFCASSEEAIGRKLDFLSQEMMRELNTLGAKVQGARLSHQVVDLKGEMEKIREQVQNIE